MLYVLVGNDNKKKSAYLKKISRGLSSIILEDEDLNKSNILFSASTKSLFGEKFIFIIENINKTDIDFTKNELENLSKSENIFVFLEDKLLASEVNKFKKFATIETFDEKKIADKGKGRESFAVAESFGVKNKFKTWLIYKEIVSRGVSPEEIAGILFWKIKMLMTYPNKNFTKEELKKISSNLVSLYHDAHLGKKDFSIGLEQFILSSLDKNQKEKA
jgi:hypothetical protein